MVDALFFTVLSSHASYFCPTAFVDLVLALNLLAASPPPALPTCFSRSLYHFLSDASENFERKFEYEPSTTAFCQKLRGGMMTILGSVRNLLVNSSVCRETQSMINSGNPEIRRLFTFMILFIVNGFELSSPISIAPAPPQPSPTRTTGPQRSTDRAHLREIALLMVLRVLVWGVLRYLIISWVMVTFSAFVRVSAFILQLLAFQASVVDPRPDIPATLPSSDEPSPLHTGRDFVMTIQFP